MTSRTVLIDRHPGRSSQSIGVARALGTDPDLIHEPSVGVVGTKGDSQCYLGVMSKVDAIHDELKGRIGSGQGQLKLRLVQPEYTIATSDGIRNGTREMRYSLIGREVTHDALCEHLSATGLVGTIAVVACDKPPVGTLAALLEHNRPAIIMSDGSIHPGTDPKTGETIDLVSAYQVAGHPDAEYRQHIACHACPGIGSCGGIFTYNTMQTFIGVLGMEPLHMVAPPSDDPRRLKEFPKELVGHLENLMAKDLKPRDIVVRDFDPQRHDRGDGDRRLDQRDPARAGDRARRGLWRLLEGHHHAGGVQLPLPAHRARAHRRASLRQVLHGRHRPGGRHPGDRARVSGRRPAERRRDDLHRRDAGGPGQAAGRRARRRQGDLQRRQALQADRRAARAGRQPVAGLLRHPQARGRRRRPGEQHLPRQGPHLRGRAGPARRARPGARAVPEPRHGHRALRGAERRAGHAGDARSDLAHHRHSAASAASSSA